MSVKSQGRMECMKTKTYLTAFTDWLKTTELFANPVKQLPGKWLLFEYYTEPEHELLHFSEEQLNQKKLFWEIEFNAEDKLIQKTNIRLPFSNETGVLIWSKAKNYITLIYPGDFRKNVEFQFAVENGNLKLLKKNSLGKIEFFGFFRKQVQQKP